MRNNGILSLFVLILCCLLFAAPVSAEYYENLYDIQTYSYDEGAPTPSSTNYSPDKIVDYLSLVGDGGPTLAEFDGVYYFGLEVRETDYGTKARMSLDNKNYNHYDVSLLVDGTKYASGRMYYSGSADYIDPLEINSVWFIFDNFDVQGLINNGYSVSDLMELDIDGNTLYFDMWTGSYSAYNVDRGCMLQNKTAPSAAYPMITNIVSAYYAEWICEVSGDITGYGLQTVSVTTSKTTLVSTKTATDSADAEYLVYPSFDFSYFDLPININITNPDTGIIYNEIIGEETSPTVDIMVYIRDVTTGSLLGDSAVYFDAILDTSCTPDPDRSNVYAFIDSGAESVTVEPGLYNITGIKSGYEQPTIPYMVGFTEDSYAVMVYMQPVYNGTPGTVYFDVFVNGDDNGTPQGWLENAMIIIDGVTKWTNSAGYVRFEMPYDSTFTYTVSYTGYQSFQNTYHNLTSSYTAYVELYTTSSVVTLTATPTPTGSGDLPSYRQGAAAAMEQLNAIIPNAVVMAAFFMFLAIMKRGAK